MFRKLYDTLLLENVEVGILLKWVLKKQVVRLRTALIWLKKEFSGGLF